MVSRERKIASIEDAFSELGTILKRVAIAPNVNNYVPHAKQEDYHTSDAYLRLYIGGNRSGKTTGGIVEDIWWLINKHPYLDTPDPTIRPVMGRLVSVDFINGIKKIIIPQLKQWIPPNYLKGGTWTTAYSESERVLSFANGSELELMSYDQDLDKFAGTSRDFIHFDEEPPEDIFNECKMRLIDRNGRAWVTMTPVEGMTWMYDAVYEPGSMGDPDIAVIEVDMHENPHLGKEEIEKATKGLSEEEKDARIKGKFVQMGGLIYKKFKVETHVIPQIPFEEFLDPNRYKIYMSLDHGLNNPTSVHWHAVDNDGNVTTFDEHYEAGKIISYHAAVILSKDGQHGRMPDIRIADPALAQRNGVTGTSIQTEYAVLGIGLGLANNDVKTGLAKVSQYVEPGPSGKPTWQITQNCPNLIREALRYRWETWATKKQQNKNNAYDTPHKKDDHAMDDCRYFFTLMPELKHAAPVAEKATMHHQLVGAEASRAVIQTVWKQIDPNLTKEALSNSNNTNWMPVLNDGDY
jgi:phage terminase large subunit-like protein